MSDNLLQYWRYFLDGALTTIWISWLGLLLGAVIGSAFALMRLRDATETSVASGDHDAVLAERLIALSEHAAAKTAAIEATFPNADTLAQARRLLAEAIHHAQHSA